MLAPVLPHLAEDMWLNLPVPVPTQSVFQGGSNLPHFPPHQTEEWAKLLQLRGDVNKCIEAARKDKLVGSNMDCEVRIHSSDPIMSTLLEKFMGDEDLQWPPHKANAVDELKYVLMVSQVKVTDDSLMSDSQFMLPSSDTDSKCSIGVTKARGSKCGRCWMYCPTVGTVPPHSDLCPRCSHAVLKWKQKNE